MVYLMTRCYSGSIGVKGFVIASVMYWYRLIVHLARQDPLLRCYFIEITTTD